MSEGLTHYDVLGVDASADKEAVRAAYQERLGEVRADIERAQEAKKPDEATIDGYRREEARVRSAWQVLSDPYQRGRYDATIEMGAGADASEDGEGGGEVEARAPTTAAERRAAARERARAAAANRPPGMFSTDHPPTPGSWPAGYIAPPPRARTMAMLIDIIVLFLFFGGAQVAATQGMKSIDPKKVDRIHQLDSIISKTSDQKSTIDDKKDAAKNGSDAKKLLTDQSNQLQKKLDQYNKERDRLNSDVQGPQFGIFSGTFLILSILYLIPSTLVSGRTLGKRLLHVRLVQFSGSRVTVSGALAHYGVPVLASLALFGILGQLAFAVALFGVLTWPRNPNLQGLHDRIAKTIVVDG
jgi:uncharacterized RDD family membrane protein YckC